jgi:hypothetical protein
MMGGMQQSILSSVNLGEMLQVMADRTEQFQKLLVEPRSVVCLHCLDLYQYVYMYMLTARLYFGLNRVILSLPPQDPRSLLVLNV